MRYWLFVILTLLLAGIVGYGAYATHRLLRTWQPEQNPLLTAGENGLRLVLISCCLLLGLISGLKPSQLGWIFADSLGQLELGLLTGSALALFFYFATQWVRRQHGQRLYSTVVIKAILPRNPHELLLVSLALLPVAGLEELLFRSLLVGGLTPLLPGPLLIIVTSLLFGLLHSPQGIWGVAGATLAGLLFGWLFIQQGSLLAPLVAHYVANLLQVVQAMRLRDQL